MSVGLVNQLWCVNLPQDFRPDHISGKLEDRICPQALADCQAFRDDALRQAHDESRRLVGT